MHDDSRLSGRRLSREVFEEKLTSESGIVLHARMERERSETFEGVDEITECTSPVLLQCGHTHSLGQPVMRCDLCSKKSRHTVLVCQKCSVRCPVCGSSVCLAHSRPSPDGNRYCSNRCKRKGKKVFGVAPTPPATTTPPVSPKMPEPTKGGSEMYPMPAARSRGSVSRLLGRVLEWW